jgi:glucosamine-6-phosphate deaminase
MNRHLFDHVDIAPNRAHVLDGTIPEAFVDAHAAEFDRWITAEGGLDLQLLGIGRNGHIGFNEPAETPIAEMLQSNTRLTSLHPTTITDAAREFGGESRVIRRALTLGVSQILAARSILLLALGAGKAEALDRALNGPVTAHCPASLLQTVAAKVTWILDEPASRALGFREA